MNAGGKHIGLLLGASLWAVVHADMALASEVRADAAAEDAGQTGAPTTPAARAQRLNPTGRAIALTVPAKDGSTYLGDMPLTISADAQLSFPADRALSLLATVLAPDVLERLRASFAGKNAVGPADFAPSGVPVEYDPRTLELRFIIPVEARASRSLSVTPLDREMLGTFVKREDFSAYLNIRGSLDLVEDGFDTGFADPVFLLDGAVRMGDVVAESDAIWIPGNNGVDFQRLGSRLVFDDLRDLIRFTGGDLETQSRGFQAAPDMAGISLVRSYSTLNPQQIIRPRGDRTFRLERPSTVEVIINGQQVRRLQLAPGNYNLRDFPFAQGANDIRLNVLDDSGRTEVLRFNIFLDQTQLAKGLTEFGVYAGVKAPQGIHGPDYSDDWTVSGFVRHGVSDFLTLGANFQADEFGQLGGIEAVLGTEIGTFGTNAAFSHSNRIGDGFAVQGTFQRLIQHANGQADTFNLFAEHRSRNFAPVPFFLLNNPFEYEVGGGYSHAFNADFYAGVDARFSKGRDLNPDVHNYRLSGGWRISPRASLTAETRYEKDSRGEEVSGFLTLTVRLGRFSSVRTEYDTRDNRMRATYQTFHGSGVGSYNVSADIERSDFNAGVNVNANYLANRAELGFSHFGNFDRSFGNSTNQRSTFRLGTSIALAGDTLSVGRPIYDSFALIKPHRGLKGADVIVEPTPFGFSANSGSLGVATMPSLSSYAERTIPVDVANAPAGTDIGQGSFKVFPAYRSGYVLEVGSDYNVTALGTMVNADGQPVALVSGIAKEINHPDHPAVTLFTNRIGRFGATGLAPGQWRIEMLDEQNSVYVIDIPADSQGIVRLGEITPLKGR
ncbi:MAG TPA: fimbrial biogenesis outer membrane usher protein [Novosphingobium sp.]|nr:fimbrial biogenesis outer membrane usher protein [Novosphingobium sp.]